MGLFVFNKINSHRRFNYKPVFYNPEKEEFLNRVRELERKHGKAEGSGQGKGEYVPGSNIKGSFKNYQIKSERKSVGGGTIKFISVIVSIGLAVAIVYLLLVLLHKGGYLNF